MYENILSWLSLRLTRLMSCSTCSNRISFTLSSEFFAAIKKNSYQVNKTTSNKSKCSSIRCIGTTPPNHMDGGVGLKKAELKPHKSSKTRVNVQVYFFKPR